MYHIIEIRNQLIKYANLARINLHSGSFRAQFRIQFAQDQSDEQRRPFGLL